MTEQQLRIEHAFTALHQSEMAMMRGQYALAADKAEEAMVLLEQINKDNKND